MLRFVIVQERHHLYHNIYQSSDISGRGSSDVHRGTVEDYDSQIDREVGGTIK